MNTSSLLDKLYKSFIWIIVGVSLVAYLAYRTISFSGDIESVVRSVDTWTNITFSIWLHLNILQGGTNSAISQGLSAKEFILADELNNKIIQSVNNEMNDFRKYVKLLNHNEQLKLEEDFLFKCGDKTFDELTKKQKRKFKKLKPIRHNIYGFNLPLYYELTRSGEIDYKANFVKNRGIWFKRLSKVITGVLFGAMTINIAFNVSGIGEAVVSLIIMGAGLIITFLMSFMQPYFKLRYEIPKSVILKSTLYNSYVDYKKGTHELKFVDLIDEEIEKDPPEVDGSSIS